MELGHQKLVNDLHQNNQKNMAELITGAYPHLEDLQENIKRTDNDPNYFKNRGVLMSPNWFSFCGLMNKTENFARTIDEEISIIFDSARQYDEDFKSYFELIKRATSTIIHIQDKSPLIFGHERNVSFTPVDSSSTRFLQISDVWATFTNRIMTKVWSHADRVEYSETEVAYLGYYFTDKMQYEDIFTDFVFSSECYLRIHRVLENNLG